MVIILMMIKIMFNVLLCVRASLEAERGWLALTTVFKLLDTNFNKT